MFFFFQAEDGILDLVRSRGLGDVYKRQQYILSPSEKRLQAPGASRTTVSDLTASMVSKEMVVLVTSPFSWTTKRSPKVDQARSRGDSAPKENTVRPSRRLSLIHI